MNDTEEQTNVDNNITAENVPGGAISSRPQLLSIVINKPFKAACRTKSKSENGSNDNPWQLDVIRHKLV